MGYDIISSVLIDMFTMKFGTVFIFELKCFAAGLAHFGLALYVHAVREGTAKAIQYLILHFRMINCVIWALIRITCAGAVLGRARDEFVLINYQSV